MEEIRDALLRMYRSARLARRLAKAMDDFDTPYHEIYGDLADAIYCLIGEHVEPFTASHTHNILTSEILLEERAVTILYYIYKQNHSEEPKPRQNHTEQAEVKQPAPNTFTFDQFRKDYEAVGGYITPEGDWK